MSKSHLLAALFVSAAVALAGCESQNARHADREDATETQIRIEDVPAPVRQAFEREYPGAKLSEVEKEVYRDGTVHYGFEFTTRDGKQMEAEFNAEGERLPEH
jgi:hypothetical protein